MILTSNELAAVSSGVAALGILGGYLGVKSANRNALKIAREERSTRRRDELNDLRRSTYARFLAALVSLATASLEQEAITTTQEIRGEVRIAAIKRRGDTLATARDTVAELDLLAPGLLRELADEALEAASACTQKRRPQFSGKLSELRAAMHHDLQASEASNFRGLDGIAYSRIAARARNSEDEGPFVEPSDSAKAKTLNI